MPGKPGGQQAPPDRQPAATDFVSGPDPGTTGMRMLDNFPEAPEGMVFEKLLVRNFVLTSSVLVQRSAPARSGLFGRR